MFTVGIPCYDDYDGVVFTVQALRLRPSLVSEIVVVDNNPTSKQGRAVADFLENCKVRYVPMTDVQGTAPAKNRVFQEATSEYVVCLDSHVLLAPGALGALRRFYRREPYCADLLHGPLLCDDLEGFVTHLDPVWNGGMWGTWAFVPGPIELPDFEIWGHGMGLFACRRDAWLGFAPGMRGFGGEEGAIHEKFRRAGRRVRCVSGLRWWHRFGRPNGAPYKLTNYDKARNYWLAFTEIGLDTSELEEAFPFKPEVWEEIKCS